MWGGTQPDPGGENLSQTPVCNQELKDLKDQFDQQQVLIAQLKEMLRKSEQTVDREKVEEYANTLTRMNARVKRSKLKRDSDVTDSTGANIDTPANEKILLLRQQMEENKLKLAERGKLHKGIEETVTQLKAQLDDSQHMITQASINLSLIDMKDENYSINSSQEELYNFLVVKDRRISDLNAKIQKLEASVLDLQENVKEKDSVIDARTKAITLMTESLSKKGKTTLDALDDTKEQMRKMQENFINMEAQMKSEKQLLVEELEAKNAENEELRLKHESPKKGRKSKKGQKLQENECEIHLTKIAEYEATITDLNLTIEELKAVHIKAKEAEESDVDVSKLKKQLDENNKNMIKVKAQHKNKIKELNRIIEEMKKNQDGAGEIKRLQDENVELTERVLKLTLNNDLAASEQVNELEMKMLEQSELVESKNRLISTLEEQITSYKAQVEQLEKFSCSENDQVVSEIRSIGIEEQLDKIQIEKTELQHKYEEVVMEKSMLLETIDNLTKDKQEISSKLDSYIQENIELIDKLEKLSSAKVSSAESIEIVEGLTQQEKFELEEYQKGLEIPENIKSSVENLESPGLNESVNQLTEETSDLLRKIELFTEERREVMDKMEALTTENTHLNMKICEVENNRDVLAETYEQVQNEKEELEAKLELEKQKVKELESNLLEKIASLQDENKSLQEKVDKELHSDKHTVKIEEQHKKESVKSHTAFSDLQSQIEEYKTLVEIQKQEIIELKLELLSQQNISVAYSNLQQEIAVLQTRYQTLVLENETLTKNLKDKSEIVHEKDALETDLLNANKRISEFSEKLNENLEEIENYKTILDENKNELIASANIINDLQNKVHTKQNEIQHYEAETERLNTIITDLSNRVTDIENEHAQSSDNMETIEIMSNQLQELKEMLNENIKQIEKYEEELQINSDTIDQLTLQLKNLKVKLDNIEQELDSKNNEIANLVEEKNTKESLIAKLQSQLKEKDQNFHEAFEKLREKCIALQNKIDENAGSLDNLNLPKMQELETKNKEQLEKMKKFAASLKKKNVAYHELEQEYKELDNKHKVLSNDIIIKVQEIEHLKAQNEHLRNVSKEAELLGSNECNDLNLEINHKNDLIKTLTAELEGLRYNSETNANALHIKVQELEMYIETQNCELSKYKEQVYKLEDGLSALEERRVSLERQAIELGNQLQEKSNSYEEISQIEDILEQRLATLMAQDKKMEKRLLNSTAENQKLQDDNKYLVDENVQLKQKLAHAIERNIDAEKVIDLENEIQCLREIMNKSESEYKRHHAEYEKKLMEKSIEVENMEIELQGQLTQLGAERKSLIVQCEQLNDQIKEHLDTQEVLQENVEKYKDKLMQQQTDFEAHIEKYYKITEENKINLNVIDQLQELSSQQVSEIEKLNKLLSEKTSEVEDYCLQNGQLQSSSQNIQEQYDLVCKQLSKLQATTSESPEKVTQINTGEAASDTIPASISEHAITFVWPDQSSTDPFDDIISQSYQNTAPQTEQRDISKIFNYFETVPFAPLESKSFENVEFQTSINAETKLDHNVDTQTIPKTSNNAQTETEVLYRIEPAAQETVHALLETNINDQESNQYLVNKVKTLEFMLFNVEKEKDDALFQCQELTTQIAQLIYEKQVCSPSETVFTNEDRRELQQVEFAPVNVTNEEQIIKPEQAYLCYKVDAPCEDIATQIVSPAEARITHEDLEQLQPIEFGKYEQYKLSEDPCEAKSAYLCYPVDLQTLESHIVTSQDAKTTKKNLQQLQDVEFTKCKDLKDVTPQTSAVSEAAEAKSAYLCFKSEDAFDENDDGWGCGSDEAKLEADYHQQQVDPNVTHNLELNAKVRYLEVECERRYKESKQLQIKSSKLVKKLKEYKALNDKLETKLRRSGEFAGLDDALQDELKIQISQLEKRVKEIILELEKERKYKSKLLEQLDVLEAANERMLELKERQDYEMLCWQRQNRELSAKLEQFEWGDGGSDSPKQQEQQQQQPDDKINELTVIINELTKDNEELQLLLEEQRNLRVAAEKAKIGSVCEEDYLNIVTDKNSLKDELTTSLEEKKVLQDQLNNLIKIHDEVQNKLDTVNTAKLTLESEVLYKNEAVDELSKELEMTKMKMLENEEISLLQNTIQELQVENLNLTEYKVILEQKLNGCEMQSSTYEQHITEITGHLHSKTNELQDVTSKLEIALREKSALTDSVHLVNDEWNQRVDQRGTDVAESWKLHLEARETEFSQVEQNLKREINELEQKCNALVNENNELRKNVDAEIRNEIDKILILEQQINDRQMYINDLSKTVQENQTALEQQHLKITEYDTLIQQINEEKTSLQLQITQKIQTISELEEKLSTLSGLQNEVLNNNELLHKLQLDLTEKQKLLEESLLKLNQSNKELDEYKEAVTLFQQQIESKDMYISELARDAHERQTQVNLLNQELNSKTNAETSVVGDITLELNHLKELLNKKEQELDTVASESETLLNEKLQELKAFRNSEAAYAEAISAKDSDLQNMKLQLLDETQKCSALTVDLQKIEALVNDLALKLDDKIREYNELQQRFYEQDLMHDEENRQVSELGGIIENQVLRIEELKHELYEKSKDYDSLIAELDIRKPSTMEHTSLQPELLNESQVQQSVSTPNRSFISNNDDSQEPISHAELDLALYMLHQRDVRCEELTVELVQLLEERDTLQLKLSNAIREREDLRKKYVPSHPQAQIEDSESIDNSQASSSPSKVSAIVLGASGTEIATEAIESSLENTGLLADKLLELKMVGYRRDKTILDEQERRRYQQLALMQDHRDIAALLPPEAAAKLVQDANYTLSRDVQSPSKVLLNWLWGRSTPRVNNV